MTLGQKEQIKALEEKLVTLRQRNQNNNSVRKRKEKTARKLGKAQALVNMEKEVETRRSHVMGGTALQPLGYSDFSDSQGGQAATLLPNDAYQDSNCSKYAMQFVDSRMFKGAKVPSSGFPSYAKQTRTYFTVEAANLTGAGGSGALTNAFCVLPRPDNQVVGYSEVDGYFTPSSITTGGITLITVPSWSDMEANIQNARCVGFTVLISPIEDLLARGGIIQGAYVPEFPNDVNQFASTGTPGTYPFDTEDSGISEYYMGSRHPLSVGMYGFWTPSSGSWAEYWNPLGTVNGANTFDNGGLIFQITPAAGASAGDDLCSVEIVANWEFTPKNNVYSGTIDMPFGNKRSTFDHAMTILMDYPRFVANDTHVSWINRLRKAASKVPGFLKTVSKYAQTAAEIGEGMAFLL